MSNSRSSPSILLFSLVILLFSACCSGLPSYELVPHAPSAAAQQQQHAYAFTPLALQRAEQQWNQERNDLFESVLSYVAPYLPHTASAAHANTHFRTMAALTPTEQEKVRATFFTKGEALKMSKQSPRFGSPSKFETSSNYLMGLAIMFGIGLAIGIVQCFLTFAYMIVWRGLIWRCCCGKRARYEDPSFPGFSPKSKWIPIGLVAFFCVFAACWCIVGLTYNGRMANAVGAGSEGSGLFAEIKNTQNVSNNYLLQESALISSINVKIEPIGTTIASLVAQSNSLTDSINSYIAQVDTYGTTWDNYQYAAPISVTYKCTVCVNLKSTVTDPISSTLNSNVKPLFTKLTDPIIVVQTKFLDIKNQTAKTTADAVNTITDLRNTLYLDASGQQKTEDYRGQFAARYKQYASPVLITILVLPFAGILIFVVAFLLHKSWVMKINFWGGIWYLLIIWLFFGLFWFLGVLVGDMCDYVDNTYLIDLNGKIGSTASDVGNACLLNNSVIAALNLDDKLEFEKLIVYPTMPSNSTIDGYFQINQLSSALSNISALTLSTAFLADLNDPSSSFSESARIDTPLNNLNALGSPGPWTRATVANCNSADYAPADQSNAATFKQQTLDGLTTLNTLTTKLAELKAGVTDLDTTNKAVQNKLYALSSLVNVGIQDALQPLVDLIREFRATAYCYFLAIALEGVKGTMCNDLTISMSWICFSAFMIGLSCFFITWCSKCAAPRVVVYSNVVSPLPSYDPYGRPVQPNGANGTGSVGKGPGGWDAPADNNNNNMYVAPSYVAQQPQYSQPQASSPPQDEGQPQSSVEMSPIAAPSETSDPAPEPSPVPAPAPASTGAHMASDDVLPNMQAQNCESCEVNAASVRCADCQEAFCAPCDALLHKSNNKATHDRVPLK